MRRTVLLLSLVGAMIMMYAGTVLATHIPPDLEIVYHEGPVKVQAGGSADYYGAITNDGGKTAEIPTGTVVAKHTVGGAAAIDYCYAPTGYTCNDTGNGTFEIVSQGANTLGVGQSLSFHLYVTAPVTDGKMTHSVTLDPNGAIGELDENNNTSDTIATYVGTPPPTDLSVTQTDNEDPTYIENGWLQYTVKVTNNGQDTAFNVSVDDQLPDNVTYQYGCNYIASENVAICSMGNIPSGESKEVTITVAPNAVGTITNTATVFSDSDPDSSNNTDKEDTVVQAAPVYEEPPPDDNGGGTTIIQEPTTPETTTKPTISSVAPAANSTTRDRTPTIKAVVRDRQTNLAKRHLKLYVDGRRVTTFSYNTSTDRLSYTTKKLSYGRHTAKIVATDASGNSVTKQWRFKVARTGFANWWF